MMRLDAANGNAPTEYSPSSEQSLANLLERLTRRLDDGESVDLDELTLAHPHHARRLRELMPTMLAMAHWGRAPASGDTDGRTKNGAALVTGVLGDFRVVRELGRGGMGTVFEAEQISMGRRVALKVLPFAALAQDKALQRFRNEVRAAAALDHPHIVSVYSVGEERGIHYYAMQLIHGQSLAETIHQLRGEHNPQHESKVVHDPAVNELSSEAPTIDSKLADPPSTKRVFHECKPTIIAARPAAERYRIAARLGIQAAEALQHAHDQGVLHRDIKPGNLLLDADGRLYITDFGLARIGADAGMTMTGDIVGTLRYMAPEQALAKRVVIDHRADIYSLGATLYEVLTLHPAFGEADRVDLLNQIAHREPPPLRQLDRHIPVELETIVLKAMAKAPEDRYQTAQLLADDFRAALENRPIRAKPPSVLQRVNKLSRRHPAAVWALVATLLIACVALSISRAWIGRVNETLAKAKSDAEAALSREATSAATAIAAQQQSADLLYAADVRLAGEALANNNVTEARERLGRHIPRAGEQDRRGFAWHYLWQQLQQESMNLTGHGPAFDVEYSPGGDLLASAHESGVVVLRRSDNGEELYVLPGPIACGVARHVDFAPGKHLVAAIFDNGRVNIWHTLTGKLLASFPAHDAENGDLAFLPDGKRLATAGGQVWNLFELPTDLAEAKEVHALTSAATSGPLGRKVFAIDVSHDGRRLAIGGGASGVSGKPGWVELWNLNENRAEGMFHLSHQVRSICFATRRDFLFCGTQAGEIGVWDVNSGKQTSQWPRHKGPVYDLAMAADDNVLLSASKDATAGLWQTSQHNPLQLLQGHSQRVYGAAISPKTDQIATASADGSVKIWPERFEAFEKKHLRHGVGEARFLDGGSRAVVGLANGVAELCDLLGGQRTPLGSIQHGMPPRISWQQDGKRFVLAGAVDASSQGRRSAPQPDVVSSVDWDGDGDRDKVAAFGATRHVIWEENLSNSQSATPRLARIPDVSANMDWVVDVDDHRTGRLFAANGSLNWDDRVILKNLKQPVSLAYTDLDTDGKSDLLLATYGDGSVAWHAGNGHTSKGHPKFGKRNVLTNRLMRAEAVTAADVTGDGKPEIVAANFDGNILFWENLGDGRFAEELMLENNLPGPHLLDIADVDADSLPDILAATGNVIVWYKYGGPAGFESAQVVNSLESATWLRAVPETTFVYDADSFELEHRVTAFADYSSRAALSPDGNRLAIADTHDFIRIWDLPSEQFIRTIATGGPTIRDLLYSPGAERLLAAVGDDLRVWDAKSFRLLYDLKAHDSSLSRIAISRDGRQIATVSDDLSVRLWSLPEGKPTRVLLGHQSPPIAAAFSHDGRTLASGGHDGAVYLWDLVTGQQLLVLRDTAGPNPSRNPAVKDLCFRDAHTLLAITEDERGECFVSEWRAK